MALNTDKNSYTIIFSVLMVLVVGALLAFLAQVLKPTISENQRIEIQQNILYAMGVNNNSEGSVEFVDANNAGEKFSEYIKKQLIIQDGEVSEDDDAYLIDLKKEQTMVY